MDYKLKINDEMIENGFADNSFTRRDTDGLYRKLKSFIGDERTAANILVLAIRQAGIETKSYDTRDIEFQVDNFIQREAKTTAAVKAIIEKRNKKPVKHVDARETVPDWDKQEVVAVTQERLDAHQARIPWFNDREKYQGNKDAYKKISKFDDWKALQTKKELSAGTDNSTHANG
ncbi:hypothetical protein G7084_01320 [Weissella coleopterorum]|uniref:Uncharacterized protein n=1 Tax=Weissella coleopterorum TaxID=2714949 RepID=A0A6G8AYK2_9LACO|nr:hypothetical protein [Weissella coleopterorum]QIL50077.1 hypothetical protein G7084_01320 [Weissella coleopterorum]